jgi:hypothetical protein
LKTWTEATCAADCSIRVSRNNSPALRFCKAAANLDLILDRCITLEVGRVSGVDDGAHGLLLFKLK